MDFAALSSALIASSEEPVIDIGVEPWVVGVVVLVTFMSLLAALLAFGKGREHS